MKKNKILSIIVPSYNTSMFIDECVPTFINDKLFELIDIYFIDDGALDDTRAKLEPYILKYPNFFHFYHKENGGHGSVINYGLQSCVKTKYFKVIDGDDYIDSESMYELAMYLLSCDDDLVVSGYYEKYSSRELMINPICSELKSNFIEKRTYGPEILVNLNITIHSSTFKTSIFKDNGILLPEKVFYEDNLFILYSSLFLKKISFINSFIYYYRLGNPNQSVSLEGRIKHYCDSIIVRQLAFEFFDNNINTFNLHAKSFYIKHIAKCLSCYRNTILYYKNNRNAKEKCLELYRNDLKYPDLIYELKKQNFHRFLFNSKFHFIWLIRRIETKKIMRG